MSRNVVHRPRRRGKQQVLARDSLLGEGIFECGDVALTKVNKSLEYLLPMILVS